jgi:thiamine-monophosphate kinase
VLAGGDDYELCFTVPAARDADVVALTTELCMTMRRIGAITADDGLRVFDEFGQPLAELPRGFDHFAV